MHKRSIIIFAIFLALFVFHTIPCAEIVVPATQAQSLVPQVIGAGAQRAPSIDIDRNDNLYLMMSGATKPASEHTPGSQIFFTQSSNYGASWDNFPLTRNLSNSKGEAFGPALFVTKVGNRRSMQLIMIAHRELPRHFCCVRKKASNSKRLSISLH